MTEDSVGVGQPAWPSLECAGGDRGDVGLGVQHAEAEEEGVGVLPILYAPLREEWRVTRRGVSGRAAAARRPPGSPDANDTRRGKRAALGDEGVDGAVRARVGGKEDDHEAREA